MLQLSPAPHRSCTELDPALSDAVAVRVDHGWAAGGRRRAVSVVSRSAVHDEVDGARRRRGGGRRSRSEYRMESSARAGRCAQDGPGGAGSAVDGLAHVSGAALYPPWLKLSVAPPPRTAAPA